MKIAPLHTAWILWGTLCLGLLAPARGAEPNEWFQAVHKADPQALAEMLAQGAEVDQKDPWGRTALTVVLLEGLGDDQLIALLLEAGADPVEPLYPVLRDDKVHALKRWLAAGNPADLPYGEDTALVWAAMHGQTAMVRVLLDAGADPNQKSQEGLSPLAHAQQRNQRETAELLFPVTEHERNLPALNDAVRQGKCNLAARLLADGAHPDSRSPASGRTPLMDAAEGGHLACVEALLAAGADPKATAPLSSPLNEAAWSDQPEILALLLAAGANACQGSTPGGRRPPMLEAASRADMVEPLRLLLDHCPKVDLRHKRTTALCMASAGGNPIKVQMLLNAGADPNARCANGLSPLHMAALWGHIESLQLLLSAGAQPALDDKGRSPRDLAHDRGHSEAAALLVTPP